MDFCNKLECLSLASLSGLAYYLWVRPGAYPRVEHLKGASLAWVGSGPTGKHYTLLERLARDKHSSLLRKSVNYGRKKDYSTGPRVALNGNGKHLSLSGYSNNYWH
jgi:hypothetical protein